MNMVRAPAVVAALALLGPVAAWYGGAAAPLRKGRLASSSAHDIRRSAPIRLALRSDALAASTLAAARLNQAESERFAPGSGVVRELPPFFFYVYPPHATHKHN
jgi:hypothetical protein